MAHTCYGVIIFKYELELNLIRERINKTPKQQKTHLCF